MQNAFFFLKTGKFNDAYKTFDSILNSEPLDVDARVGLIGCKSKGFGNGYPERCDDWKLLLGLLKESVLLAKYPELKSFKGIVTKGDELLNRPISLYARVPFGKWTGIDNECCVIENSGTKVKLMTYHAAGEFKYADYPSVNELLKALNGKLLDTLIPEGDRKKLVPFENGSLLSLPSVEELVSASFYFTRRGFGALNANEDASKTPYALLAEKSRRI